MPLRVEARIEENPWKNKSRIKYTAGCDVVLAFAGIAYASYRMFTFYINIKEKEVDSHFKGEGHLAFYYFVWATVVLLYIFQIGASCVLYTAVNLEATETDPYVAVQKCHCWLRCSRLILFVVVIKLCLHPAVIYFGKIESWNGFFLGIVELILRTVWIFGVKRFIQDLQ